tara:strand:+ start:653 stop:991 length:339 start_codon:yes stop_codon:yes gene_type:complete
MPKFKKNSSAFTMKNSALKAGAKGSPMQSNYSKPSPLKEPITLALLLGKAVTAVKGAVAGAGGISKLAGAALKGAATTAGGQVLAGGGNKSKSQPIVTGKQIDIMGEDNEQA